MEEKLIDTEDLIDTIIGAEPNFKRLSGFLEIKVKNGTEQPIDKPVYNQFVLNYLPVNVNSWLWIEISSYGGNNLARARHDERRLLLEKICDWVDLSEEYEMLAVHEGRKGEVTNGPSIESNRWLKVPCQGIGLRDNRIDVFISIRDSSDEERTIYSSYDFRWLSFLTVDDQNQVFLSSAQQIDLHKRLDHMSSHDCKIVDGSRSVVAKFLQNDALSYRGIRHICSTCGYNPKVQGEWHSCCPVCKLQANNKKELESRFGWRTEKYKGKPRKYPQARCKKDKNV